MYSVVLAEDETSIRENIHRGIDWGKYNFEIVAEVSHGEDALEAVKQHQPDLLITDIRMPFMDGLDLCKIVKKLYPDIKIIILSGFMEFAYAQEALRIGVQEYIVKPITPTKLIRILVKLNEQLEEEARNTENVGQLWDEINRLENLLKQKLYGDLSSCDLNDEIAHEKLLINFLEQGYIEEVENFTEEYFCKFVQQISDSLIYYSYFMIKNLECCIKVIKAMGGQPKDILAVTQDLDNYMKLINNKDQAKRTIMQCYTDTMAYRDRLASTSAGVVSQAKRYVELHYDSTELTVGEVARHVNMSANYFSNIFKQNTGNGFVKYLTNYRIEKAKTLLKTSNYTLAEIAERVGYSSPQYFASVFHKNVGIPPKEFKVI